MRTNATRSPARKPTRAELSTVRRREYFQSRLDAAETPVDLVGAAWAYFAAVLAKVDAVKPGKAEEVAKDVADYLIRQASAHERTAAR